MSALACWLNPLSELAGRQILRRHQLRRKGGVSGHEKCVGDPKEHGQSQNLPEREVMLPKEEGDEQHSYRATAVGPEQDGTTR